MDNWVNIYCDFNTSCVKKAVYRVGIGAGFFSEYNNMLIAILYCIKNNIKFVLSSSKNNFSYDKGWKDYFLPFCEETSADFHINNNFRSHESAPNSSFDKIYRIIYKQLTDTEYLTQDIWKQMRSQYFFEQAFFFPSLSIQGGLYDSLKVINQHIWRFQPYIKEEVENKVIQLELPAEYIGLHIRSGDKKTEYEVFSVDAYLKKAAAVSACTSLFVATDDFANVQEIRKKYPAYTVYSLCSEEMSGFDEYTFNQKEPEYRRASTLALLVDVELLARAGIFIGTYSSNVGMFMGLRRDLATCYGLDFDRWRVW